MAQRVKNKPELKIVVSNTPETPAVEPAPEQVEMPFAIVNGEPVTQMPKDLYIPPQAMEVFLEAFEGPLDLLLYLIRRQNLNILDIPLAEITRQYMQYIEVMTELQLELAGEYMVMAATLAEIKSRMLLPRPKVDPEGKEEDPRAELVRRLQEYERFKRAAEDIDTLPRLERDVWPASAELKDRSVVKLLPTVTLQEMLLAFKDVVVRSEMFAHHHISRERLSVRERMSDVLTQLAQASFVEFIRLFRLEEGRMGVTVTFMALLELVREGLIEIVQAVPFAPLHVRAAGASRKLHVVGGNDALADGTLADGTAALADGTVIDDATAVVVGEAVVGDVPAVGLLLPGDAGLDTIVEQVLDPNFVDDDFDEDDEPLEGVDDIVDRLTAPAAPAPAVAPADAGSVDVPAAPDREVALADAGAGVAGAIGLIDVLAAPDREVPLADAGAGVAGAIGLIDVLAAPDREVALADAGASADAPGSGEGVGEAVLAVAGSGADVTEGGEVAISAALADVGAGVAGAAGEGVVSVAPADFGAGADPGLGQMEPAAIGFTVEAVSVVDEWAASVDPAATADTLAEDVAAAASFTGEAADFQAAATPHDVGASVDLTPLGMVHEPPDAPEASDAVAFAVESVLVVESADVSHSAAGVAQDTIVAQQPSAYEVAAAELAESPSSAADAVVGSASALDEAGAVVESVSAVGNIADPFDPTSAVAEVTLSSIVDEASHSAFMEVVEPISALHPAPTSARTSDEGSVTIEPVSPSDVNAFGEAAVAPLLREPTDSVDLTDPVDLIAAVSDAGAVVELTPMVDLSPLADLVTTDVSTSAGVVPAADVSSPNPSTSDFSAPLVDLAAPDVQPTVAFVTPDEAASPDVSTAHVSAPPSDSTATDVSDPVDFVAADEVALPDSTAIQVYPPLSDLVTTDVSDPVDFVATDDAPSASFGAVTAGTSDTSGTSAGTSGNDIAVSFDPSVTAPAAVADEPLFTDVSAAASEPTAIDESAPAPVGEPSDNDEVGVMVDPAVFDAPTAAAESEPPADTSLDEPPAFDAEYESPEEAVAAGEQPAADEDVSLIGDTPVAGEASLVGDESVSGGPAVEVEEFAFDELPALDDVEPADQQPAAGAEAVVNKVPGTDVPPSPGEESDD